jgi:hypothetical protein
LPLSALAAASRRAGDRILDARTLRALAEAGNAGETRVSIYLTCDDPGAQQLQAPTKLDNQRKEALGQLGALGWSRRPADALLAALEEFVDDERFWRAQAGRSSGVAFLLSSSGLLAPIPVDAFPREATRVGERYWLKPLYGELRAGEFYLLALSQARTALLRGTRRWIEPVEDRSLPSSLEEVVGTQVEPAGLQLHSGPRGGDQSARAAVYHGQGAGNDDVEPELERFCRAVAQAVAGLLPERVPLLLAAAEPLASAFRRAAGSSLPLLSEDLAGNPDRSSNQELQARALPILERHWERERDAALSELGERIARGEGASEFDAVLRACVEGRVETLYAAADRELDGCFDPAEQRLALPNELSRPGAGHDLFDLCLAESFTRGAEVGLAPASRIPGAPGVAAAFRF